MNEVLEQIFLHRYRPRPGDTIVELGASGGSESFDLAAMVGEQGLVLAVEASPELCAQITERALPQIWVRQAFVDDGEVGTLLDEITRPLEQIDLLKANIEGSEAAVCETSPQTLAKTRNAVISCHDFVGIPTRTRVLAALEQAGFTVTRHSDPLCITDGYSGRCIGDYLYASR